VASLSIVDLVDAVSHDPRYASWKKQVPADVALQIVFGSAAPGSLTTVVQQGADGRQIILEIGRTDGKLYGIEIT
jgi:hypothetical protein